MFFWYFIQGQSEIVYILILSGTNIQQQFVKPNAAISECSFPHSLALYDKRGVFFLKKNHHQLRLLLLLPSNVRTNFSHTTEVETQAEPTKNHFHDQQDIGQSDRLLTLGLILTNKTQSAPEGWAASPHLSKPTPPLCIAWPCPPEPGIAPLRIQAQGRAGGQKPHRLFRAVASHHCWCPLHLSLPAAPSLCFCYQYC